MRMIYAEERSVSPALATQKSWMGLRRSAWEKKWWEGKWQKEGRKKRVTIAPNVVSFCNVFSPDYTNDQFKTHFWGFCLSLFYFFPRSTSSRPFSSSSLLSLIYLIHPPLFLFYVESLLYLCVCVCPPAICPFICVKYTKWSTLRECCRGHLTLKHMQQQEVDGSVLMQTFPTAHLVWLKKVSNWLI